MPQEESTALLTGVAILDGPDSSSDDYNQHSNPDSGRRGYQPRIFLNPSNIEREIAEKRRISAKEEAEISTVLARLRRPNVYIDRSAPLCHVFVPQSRDESSLLECEMRKTPEALFPPQWNRGRPGNKRYIHIRDRGMVLLQTDGACLDNGRPLPSSGYAFVLGPPLPGYPNHGLISIKLPRADATSNRAELIAVIVALGARAWVGEGFEKVVIATDSEYVVKGCTERCRKWQSRGWKTAAGRPVKNKDLWEELIWTIEQTRSQHCEVMFWQIPREWNSKADAAAKSAAARNEESESSRE